MSSLRRGGKGLGCRGLGFVHSGEVGLWLRGAGLEDSYVPNQPD